jgi:hypothetical protein
VRVGDREREHVVELLRHHAAEGRLAPAAARGGPPGDRSLGRRQRRGARRVGGHGRAVHDFWPKWVLIVRATLIVLARVLQRPDGVGVVAVVLLRDVASWSASKELPCS